MNYEIYYGQKTNLSKKLIDTHLVNLNKNSVIFEFEQSTNSGWKNNYYQFPYYTIITLLELSNNMDKDDGLYFADESRMIDIIANKTLIKIGEQELAKILFDKIIS
jgi:hypothetical protein